MPQGRRPVQCGVASEEGPALAMLLRSAEMKSVAEMGETHRTHEGWCNHLQTETPPERDGDSMPGLDH